MLEQTALERIMLELLLLELLLPDLMDSHQDQDPATTQTQRTSTKMATILTTTK